MSQCSSTRHHARLQPRLQRLARRQHQLLAGRPCGALAAPPPSLLGSRLRHQRRPAARRRPQSRPRPAHARSAARRAVGPANDGPHAHGVGHAPVGGRGAAAVRFRGPHIARVALRRRLCASHLAFRRAPRTWDAGPSRAGPASSAPSGHAEGAARHPARRQCTHVLNGHTRDVLCCAPGVDWSLAFTGGADMTVRMWRCAARARATWRLRADVGPCAGRQPSRRELRALLTPAQAGLHRPRPAAGRAHGTWPASALPSDEPESCIKLPNV